RPPRRGGDRPEGGAEDPGQDQRKRDLPAGHRGTGETARSGRLGRVPRMAVVGGPGPRAAGSRRRCRPHEGERLFPPDPHQQDVRLHDLRKARRRQPASIDGTLFRQRRRLLLRTRRSRIPCGSTAESRRRPRGSRPQGQTSTGVAVHPLRLGAPEADPRVPNSASPGGERMIANESRDHVSADPYGPECPAVTSRAKRAMDVVVAGIALTALGPLMLLIGAAVRLTSRGPALFRQERVGLRGEPFTMLKFRSMVVDNDDSAHRELCTRQLLGDEDSAAEDGVFKLDDDPRVTAVGRWLRRLSLDELPQLINVLRGDMSIVGPRPALQWEVDLYPPRHLRRLAV